MDGETWDRKIPQQASKGLISYFCPQLAVSSDVSMSGTGVVVFPRVAFQMDGQQIVGDGREGPPFPEKGQGRI
jgi:hypothetical protein